MGRWYSLSVMQPEDVYSCFKESFYENQCSKWPFFPWGFPSLYTCISYCAQSCCM